MSDSLNSKTFLVIKEVRLQAYREIADKIHGVEMAEDAIRNELRRAVPLELSSFIRDNCVIGDLLKDGVSSTMIICGDNQYGFQSKMQVTVTFLTLVAAWRGAIEIEFSGDEKESVIVVIKAL